MCTDVGLCLQGVTHGQSLEEAVPVPRETDVLVVGGGAVGSSVAYWLKQRNPKGMAVTVVERDPHVSCGPWRGH